MCCLLLQIRCLFFFFKQKTAYEMRISDWSSDVCSSDLASARVARARAESARGRLRGLPRGHSAAARGSAEAQPAGVVAVPAGVARLDRKSTRLNSSH